MTIDRRADQGAHRHAARGHVVLTTLVAVFQGALVAGAPLGEHIQGGATRGPLTV